MRIGNFRIFKENVVNSAFKTSVKQSVAPFFGYLFELGKLFVVCLVMFQMFTQPMQVLAQSRPILEVAQKRTLERPKIKPQIDDNYEGFLPEIEKRTRRAVSNAFGVNIPLPQVFGENGKLHSLLAGNNTKNDKNKELIESALNDSQGNLKKESMPTETVISLNAPILNAGVIEGSLRVSKEANFNLNNNFRITENLYTAGSPDISTQNDSALRDVINDDRDELAQNYSVFLNGGKIDGSVYIHSFTGNTFSEIPLALPKPTGSEIVEINSANDLKNIKDWKSIRSLTVNAANLEIQIPPGNYENITLNAPTKLKFSDGNYNFSDTINFQKGSLIKIGGKTTLGIGKNLLLEDSSIIAAENVQTEDFKLNVLGSNLTLSGKSEINGLVRAPNANVILNDKTKIGGHLIAGSLVMNGGIVTKYAPNSRALFFANEDNIAVVNDGITLNGRIEGSIQQRTGQTTILNSNAVITGDLLAPGVPSVVKNGNPNFGGTITGTGSATPTGYQVILNSNSSLRKLKNRMNPPTMPTVPTPTASTGTVNVVINNSSQYPTNFSNVRDITMNSNAGLMTLPPGNYRNITINSNSGIKLGTSGQTTPVTYNLNNITVNSNSQIQILSPVILNLGSGLNLNSSAGVLQNPQWLKVNVSAGSINLNSNSSLYGALVAPSSTVTINSNSLLVGNVVCKKLTINSNGILRNVLPNLLSDTNISITSPVNNATTTNTSIAVSGTAQSSAGVSNVFVNNQAATFNSSNNTWTISNVPLVLGSNIITARVVDNSGTEVSTQITVVRQSPIVDGEPPSVSISSPVNNSITQAQTITVSGVAADLGTNPSGVASVSVNGKTAVLGQGGNWTVSGVLLNLGANTITATATDNAGNNSTASITVTRQEPDTTAPTLSIVSPANNSETTEAAISVSGTVADEGTNPSGVASVSVNGQAATINGSGWTIENVALVIGSNTIIANAIDNAGNSTSRQITVTRTEPDTTAPEVVITNPTNNFETNDEIITLNGTANDLGTNASGIESVKINGQNANYSNGVWTFPNFALNIGANTINVKARDIAGNEGTATVTVIRREPDTQAPTVSITSPADNFQTTDETLTIQGNASDDGANSSGLQSVIVNGVSATISGNTWTASNVPLTIGANTITVTARDNSNNTSAASVTVIRNPLDTQSPTISIVSPTDNFETFDSQIVVSGTATDGGDGATGVQSVAVNGVSAIYNAANNTWSATVNLVDGVNQITVSAIDNAPNPNQSQAIINVTKVAVLPPSLTITNPVNGAFLSTNSVTVAGNVSSNKPDMSFAVSVNGEAANLAGREFTKTLNLTDGANVITVSATDAFGQQVQQAITVTNDRTPPSVILTNIPQVVNPGESYTIGATAADAYGVADVEFTVDGASVLRSSVSPYQFTLNIPTNQAPNQTINISAIARDNAGLSATATARVVTNGPSGLTGYVFDDATGYVLPLANARLNNQTTVTTDENGLYSFIATTATGNILLTKQGYTSIERSYSASAGSGVEIFDARLTPIDSKANVADTNGAVSAADSGDKIQVQFAPNSFPSGTDVRITPLSPQGLANLLPYGWSPIPDAIVDIRTSAEEGFSNRNFAAQATLSIPQVAGLPSDIPIVLARYNSATHNWITVQTSLLAGSNGALSANISASGQYAFLVADTGATAPPIALNGENLPASAAANSEQLDSATATAFASPSVALYTASAKSRISFVANSNTKLPSGISIEASFNDSYLTLVDRTFIAVDRPSQDFVLYSFPAVSTTEPNKLGAYFVAKPIRTDFGVTDLLNAKVHVDVRSGRLSQTGILIGQTGGIVRGSEGSELEIPGGATNGSQIVFFNKIPSNQSGVILPENYEILGAFEVNINGNPLSQSAKISMPAVSGDNSKIVAAKVISVGGQQGLKVVARVIENNSRLETNISQPNVPVGVNLNGIKDGGKYVFVRLPNAFGYLKGTVSSALPNTNAIKITNTQTPFVDVAVNNGNYTVLGLANNENVQVDAVSLSNDATGFNTASVSAQDAVVNLPINLASAVLTVQTVTPTNNAANIVVTTPITVTFNKPILASSVTGSNIKLVTASGNPVIATLTTLAGGRTITLTPLSNLQSATNYKIQLTTNIKDIYGNPLANAFESTFRTAEPIAAANQLQPSQIRISYPNESGFSTISIPAGSVPSGSTIIAINNSTGATVSTVAGTTAIELLIQARVGDEIELIIRQPDGTEYRVKQAAYRRADGFVSVGSNGGTITSDDGTLALIVPVGAIGGQADLKISFAPESGISLPRTGEMSPEEMFYIGGVKIEAQGNFTNSEELHLELPAPTNVVDGQRAIVMKESKIDVGSSEVDAWETITSAKVESGKIKSTSPPFSGINLTSALVTGVFPLFYYVFVPQRQRVVTGLVRKQKTDGSFELVTSGTCEAFPYNPAVTPTPTPLPTPGGTPTPTPTPLPDELRIFGQIRKDGRFAFAHNAIHLPGNWDVLVQCTSGVTTRSAVGSRYIATQNDPGTFGFDLRYANIIFPSDSPVNLPPQISIQASTLSSEGTPLPADSDPLKLYGKTQVGSTIQVVAVMIPENARVTSQQLYINGSAQNVELNCSNEQNARICGALIPTPTAGRYSFVVKARTNLSDATTETTATLNFVVLNNPNERQPIYGVNPAVISVTPIENSNQIDVGTTVHLEFTEPVKNLSNQTVYLLTPEGIKVNGKLSSGGIPITAADARSVIDFTPDQILKGGTEYTVVVKTDVIDISEGAPNAVPPIPADPVELRKLDQNSDLSGLQEFNSKFKTFQGTVITPTPITAQGFKIAVLDDFVVTTSPVLNGLASSGMMQLYDSTTFVGAGETSSVEPLSSLFIPHVPLGLAAKKISLNIDGGVQEVPVIAVTTLSMDTQRPRNVWFYTIDVNTNLRLLSVVSLIGDGNGGQVPNSVSLDGQRAYIGSSSNGGIYVVDIQQAVDLFAAADNSPNDGNEYNNTPVFKAVAPNNQFGAGGFGQEAMMQRATLLPGNDFFAVSGVSAITQLIGPFAYAASNKQKIVGFRFDISTDGFLGFLPGGQNNTDQRALINKDTVPASSFTDLKAANLQIQAQSKSIAVGVSSHLFIFDVSNPGAPKQYPLTDSEISQPPAKSFAELGVPAEFGSIARQVEIEGTLVYVMFDNGVAVFDITNPNEPYMTTAIRGLNGLRRIAVKDGFIFALGNNGLNVAIGRAVAQVITYGYDPNLPDDVCGNPVVIRKNLNTMAQPAGIFFQLYGHAQPREAKVIIRKIENDGGSRTETVIATVPVNQANLRTISNESSGTYIITGKTFWEDNSIEITPDLTFTAEVVIDDNFHSQQVDIPFSNLLPENLFQKNINVKNIIVGQITPGLDQKENVGSFTYLTAGKAVNVEFSINNGPGIELYDSLPATRQAKSNTRPFGSNTDYVVTGAMADGLYGYKYKAHLKANPSYFEEVTGILKIGNESDDVRKPGSTVVAGVEINSGNLAVSENDISIKGRGVSLEFTRSYNSQSADRFSTLGYGWTHNYQISLTHVPGGYIMLGGEGSGQTFLESKLVNNEINAEAPNLGKLVKNTDGTFDYFSKSYIKYHFRQPVEQGSPNAYLGNLEYIEDPNKNRTQVYYDVFGRISSVADSANRRLNFEYEAAENIYTGINVGDAIQGLQSCPKFSQYKQITRRLEQSVSGKAYRIKRITGTNIGGLTIDYVYDEKSNLISVKRDGADSTISQETASSMWKYEYNPTKNVNGNPVDEKYDHILKGVQSPNNVTNENDSRIDGAAIQYTYFLSATAPPRVEQIQMPEGINNSFTYIANPATNIIQSATFTDGNLNTTEYLLEDGRVTTVTAPLGAVTQLEWTEFGQVKKTTDPEGKVTEIIFDENNNPSTQIQTGGDSSVQTVTTFDAKFGKMSSSKDANGNLTRYSINQANGNIDEVFLPTGRSVLMHYYPNGDMQDVTDQYGTKTEFTNYDSYGNPQTITKNIGGQSQVISQTFDARSRQRSKADSLGTNVTLEYDGLDRITRQVTVDPTGYRNALTIEMQYLPEGEVKVLVQKDGATQLNRTDNLYDKVQRIKQTKETVAGYLSPFIREFTYDNNSNVKTEQDRRGILTEKFYNELNFQTKVVQGGKIVWQTVEMDKLGNPKIAKDLYGNQTVYIYDGLKRLIEKRLPENVTERLEYDKNNNIVKSFDHNNNKTEYEFDSQNRILKMTDALGRLTKWTYADADHIVEKEIVSRGLREITKLDGMDRPMWQEIRFSGNNYRTEFEYDGRDIKITDPRGTVRNQKMSGFGEAGEVSVENTDFHVTSHYSALGGVLQTTDALGRVTNSFYDGFNRRTSVNFNGEFSENWKYDGEGQLVEHTDKRGFVWTMTYDDLGREFQTFVNETVPTARTINVESHTYLDEENKQISLDANQHQTTWEYDGLRRVKKVTNSEGKFKSYTYDGENLLTESDLKGRNTEFKYDVLNRVREIYDRNNGHTLIDYSDNDLSKQTTDRRGNTVTEEYDALGRLINSYDRVGKIVSVTYDENSNRKTQQDGNNNQTTFDYDALNRLKTITHPNNLQTETFDYDAVGNLTKHSDGRGGVTETLEYDTFNQAKKIKDGEGHISEFRYDGGGLLLSKKDPKLFVTSYRYNALGSLTEVSEAGQTPWKFNYDDGQNLTSFEDPLGRVVRYEYDTLNRLKKTIQPMTRTTEYEYDENSNIVSVKDPKGQLTTLTYTALDDVDTANYNNQITHDFSYDAEQNLWSVDETRTNGGTRSYKREYDERNRLKRNTDPYNKSVSYTFDAANNLKTLTDAAGRITNYNYDAKNQLDTVVQNDTTIANYDWFTDGLLEKVTYQSNKTRVYGYDNADRISKITNTIGNFVQSYDYGYDENSNRTSEIKKENGVAKRTASYQFDELDRLVEADYLFNVEMPNPPSGQQAQYVENTEFNNYQYDAVGNRTRETNKVQTKTVVLTTDANGSTTRNEQTEIGAEAVTTATFNDLNELTELNEGNNNVSNFEYDLNGNLKQIVKNSSIISKYEYDSRNQLISAKDGLDNELAKFDYDFERKRLSKTGSTGTTNYVYAGSQVINETQNSATTAIYTLGADEIVKSEFSNGENNLHFSDALGSVTSLADVQSLRRSNYEYNAFGEVASSGDSSVNSLGYTGQRLDNETGLMALGNGERYYSPSYARFIQQDSWLGRNQMPQTMNRFSYGYNNPFKYHDPSGNEGVVADGLKNQEPINTGHENLDWWLNFGRAFITGYTYDSLNMVTLGAVGMLDVMAQDAINGKIPNPVDAWNRGGYGASPTQIAKNFAYYTAGVAKGAFNVVVGLPVLAYGLITDPIGTAGQMYQGLAEATGNMVDTLADPRGALDRLAQHSQEDIAFGVGETVGETVAGEGVGLVAGKALGFVGKVLGKTKVGSAIGKVFTEAGSKFGALRQGIQSFEKSAVSKFKSAFRAEAKNAERFTVKEMRQKVRSQMEKGFTKEEASQRIREGKACFVAGTLVYTKDGKKKIEEIKQGDEVLSYNTATHQYEYKTVARTFERYSEEVLSVKIESEREALGVTPEHPFYVRVHGARSNLSAEDDENEGVWTAAKNLQIGDEVLQTDGTWSKIESITKRDSGAKVYNFEVSDNHDYFVGENGTLVHNTCQKPGGYERYDVDRHGNLSPGTNRSPGNTRAVADNQVQSHHFIQDKWAKENIANYSRNNAPAVLLETGVGLEHTFITNAQELRRVLSAKNGQGRWGGSNLRQEFQISYREMVGAGVPEEVIRRVAKKSYKYFDSIGGF